MDYALAKELKDAGFPLRQNHWEAVPLNFVSGLATFDGVEYLYPTLEELIEASIPDGFWKIMLAHPLMQERERETGIWLANTYDFKASAKGKTPTEAVARLWLALNPRDR